MQLHFTHHLVSKNDEPRPWGLPWGCTKCAKWAKMAKIGKMGKNNEIKMKKFSISHLKSMQLYLTHQLVPKNDEPRPWGGP